MPVKCQVCVCACACRGGGCQCVQLCGMTMASFGPEGCRPQWLVAKVSVSQRWRSVFSWIPRRCSGFAKVRLIIIPLTQQWLFFSAECWSTHLTGIMSVCRLSERSESSAHCEPSTEFLVSFTLISARKLNNQFYLAYAFQSFGLLLKHIRFYNQYWTVLILGQI